MTLTKSEIRLILDKVGAEVISEPSDKFPFTITRRGFGYSDDPTISTIQHKLSIMLAAARGE